MAKKPSRYDPNFKKNYEEYLKSEHWRSIRAKFKKKRCWCCAARENLDLHHRTYKTLWHESSKDLVTVCRSCHILIHSRVRLGKRLIDAHYGVKKLLIRKKRKGKGRAELDG